jgi:hypothetical protein
VKKVTSTLKVSSSLKASSSLLFEDEFFQEGRDGFGGDAEEVGAGGEREETENGERRKENGERSTRARAGGKIDGVVFDIISVAHGDVGAPAQLAMTSSSYPVSGVRLLIVIV